MKSISINEYTNLMWLYNENGDFCYNKKIKKGDIFLMREPEDYPQENQIVTVYIAISDSGEFIYELRRIE